MDEFGKMVRANHIQNCPITSKEITNSKVIFGLHLSWVREDTVRRTPKLLDSDSVAIPRDFQLLHKSVTSVVNLIFVNGIPFFIPLSRKLRFVTVNTHAI